jgi:hypothetical protein
LEEIITTNPTIDLYFLPRVNIVRGLTHRHIAQYGWNVTQMAGYRTSQQLDPNSDEYQVLFDYGMIEKEENGYVTYNQPIIQFPDYQGRIYRNSPDIKWAGKIHERIVGAKSFSTFPADPEYAIQHFKDIKRQEEQNSLYEQLQKEETNVQTSTGV